MGVARARIADAVKGCGVTAGAGAVVDEGGMRVRLVESGDRRGDVETFRVPVRFASSRVLELAGDRVFINCPPLYGAVPMLEGRSVLEEPRPWLRAGPERQAVYVLVTWTRTNVSLAADPETEEEAKTAGLVAGDAAAEVLVQGAEETAPGDITPVAGSDLVPYAGAYRRVVKLGEFDRWGVEMDAGLDDALGSEWIGGSVLATVGDFDAGTWGFVQGEVS